MKQDNAVFHDIHAYEEATDSIVLGANYLQLEQGLPTIQYALLDFGDVVVRLYASSHAMLQGVRVEKGWLTVVLMPVSGASCIWNGVDTISGGLGIVYSECDYDATTPAGWSAIEIDISEALIASEDWGPLLDFADRRHAERCQLPLPQAFSALLRRELLPLIFRLDLVSCQNVLRQDLHAVLRRRVLDLVASALRHTDEDARHNLHRLPSNILARRARAIIEQQLTDNPSIDCISRELGVAPRTLQRCFSQIHGVSPKQYQLARKLDAARRAFRQRGRRSHVTDIAYEYGFASPSRFAEHYHRQFGETPLESVGYRPV